MHDPVLLSLLFHRFVDWPGHIQAMVDVVDFPVFSSAELDALDADMSDTFLVLAPKDLAMLPSENITEQKFQDLLKSVSTTETDKAGKISCHGTRKLRDELRFARFSNTVPL